MSPNTLTVGSLVTPMYGMVAGALEGSFDLVIQIQWGTPNTRAEPFYPRSIKSWKGLG